MNQIKMLLGLLLAYINLSFSAVFSQKCTVMVIHCWAVANVSICKVIVVHLFQSSNILLKYKALSDTELPSIVMDHYNSTFLLYSSFYLSVSPSPLLKFGLFQTQHPPPHSPHSTPCLSPPSFLLSQQGEVGILESEMGECSNWSLFSFHV